MSELAWLIPLFPILAALWIGLGSLAGWNRGEAGERHTARTAVWASLLPLLLLLVLDIQALLVAPLGQVVAGQWLASGSY